MALLMCVATSRAVDPDHAVRRAGSPLKAQPRDHVEFTTHAELSGATIRTDSSIHRLLTAADSAELVDSYDLGFFWECASGWNYVPDTGSGPGPCLGLSYDGLTEACGTSTFTGAEIEVLESQTDNGDGTITVIVQVAAADGSDLLPAGFTCSEPNPGPGNGIHTLGCDCGKMDGGGPGVPGDPIDPDLGDFLILEAEAHVLGQGGNLLLAFELASQGNKASVLKDRFTVGGADQVVVTALQFHYVLGVGEPLGACCFEAKAPEICKDGVDQLFCETTGGTYLGDFTSCPFPGCGPPVNDFCTSASRISDGSTPFDTTGATRDPAAPKPCDPAMLDDLWFEYFTSCTGDLNIAVQDGGGGFVMEVFCGSDCETMSSEYCVTGPAPEVAVPTTAGQPYMIRLGGADGADVSGNLIITCTPIAGNEGGCCLGDYECADGYDESACTAAGGNYLGNGNVCGATAQFLASSSAAVIDTCGSNYNTVLTVSDVCGGTMLAHNDDCADTLSGAGADPDASCYDPNTSSGEQDSCVCIRTTSGTTYFIQVHGFGGNPPPPGGFTSLFVLQTAMCTLPAAGACSLPDFTCVDGVTANACENNNGTYQGDDSTCAPDCNSNGVPDGVDIAQRTSQDCNLNDIPDECDIAAGTSLDLNRNGIPDECRIPPCPWDFNDDGAVNAADLAVLLGSWGPCPGCPADFNLDKVVGSADLAQLLGHWGPCP